MRIAVVVKQVPAFTEMALDADGRLIRTGLPLEMNPYCRRAVSQAVDLAAAAARRRDGRHARAAGAEDVLREAIAWGSDRGVEVDGILVSDPAFAGSDTLATARALAAALRLAGPFDLVLAGATRSTPRPGRSRPSSPSCSTSRCSPASGSSGRRGRRCTPAASTTTAGSRPRSPSRPC